MADVDLNIRAHVLGEEELKMLATLMKKNERGAMNFAQVMQRNQSLIAKSNMMTAGSAYNRGRNGFTTAGFNVGLPANTVGMKVNEIVEAGRAQMTNENVIGDVSKVNESLDEQAVSADNASRASGRYANGQNRLRTAQRSFLAINMSMLGTWFSMMSVMNMASRMFTTILNPLKDIGSAMTTYGTALAFAGEAGFDVNNIVDDQNGFVEDSVDTWMKLQGIISYVGVAMMDLANSLFSDEKFMSKLNTAIETLVTTMGDDKFRSNVGEVAGFVLDIAQGFLDAFTHIGNFLTKLKEVVGEDNLSKLGKMAGYVAAISLVGMPVASLLNLGLSGAGGFVFLKSLFGAGATGAGGGILGGAGASTAGGVLGGAGGVGLTTALSEWFTSIGTTAGASAGNATFVGFATVAAAVAGTTLAVWSFYDLTKKGIGTETPETFYDNLEKSMDKQGIQYDDTMRMVLEETRAQPATYGYEGTDWMELAIKESQGKEVNIYQYNTIEAINETWAANLFEKLKEEMERQSSSLVS